MGDAVRALAWMMVAIAARLPLVVRIEGAHDSDQSVVGLMALDIAAGRRWPLFFDGQRYMGAVEGYVAAAFVLLFGHSPTVVAFSPLLFFGLFVAGQYLLWSRWADRTTGHLAGLVTLLGSPMLAVWSIIPRGGYIEVLAWALPVLWIYRRSTRVDVRPLGSIGQAAWGFFFALGYFLNPLSLIVYLTLALDWTFGRHGSDLRRERRLNGGWLDSWWAPLGWVVIAVASLVALGACCHVQFRPGIDASPFVFLMGWLPDAWAKPLGLIGTAAILAGAAWFSGAASRITRLLANRPWFSLGMIVAFMPFVVHDLLARWGILPSTKSLPMWIRAPWDLSSNLSNGYKSLGILVGCDPEILASLNVESGVPPHILPTLSRGLAGISPLVVALVVALIASVGWNDRRTWCRFWSLRGEGPTPPSLLALLGLGVSAALYLLQSTSLNASSNRYLFTSWIVLPGLLASGLRNLPHRWRLLATFGLLIPWGVAQMNLWNDMVHPSPLSPLARELDRRGVDAIVSHTTLVVTVVNLTHGKVGGMEYPRMWPRLLDRYSSRFQPGKPLTCVIDVSIPSLATGGLGWAPRQDLGERLREIANRAPRLARRVVRVGPYEVWDVDLPLSEVLPPDGATSCPSK
jgi:hypothetical protein